MRPPFPEGKEMRIPGSFIMKIAGYCLPAILLLGYVAWAQVVPQPGPPTPIACAYNTSPVTLTNGQAGWVQCSATGSLAVTSAPATDGGLSNYFVQPTASTNAANIKNGAGQVYKVTVTNNSATVNYLRLYNAGTGFNGCNSATNLAYQVAIPGSTSGAGIVDSWVNGLAFATGISICVTSGYATNDTTNATASAMSVNIGYK